MRADRARERKRGRGRDWNRDRGRIRNRSHDRGQLSLTLVEAAVGLLFVLGVTAAFSLGPAADPVRDARLDGYADDALTVLGGDAPATDAGVRGDSRLAAAGRSPEAFERERGALRNRTAAVLPANVAFRIHTPQGNAGFERPPDAQTGEASVVTARGRVTLRVWYA